MTEKKIRCFVAMAFGWNDTDEMYDNFVERFKHRLTIRRVDRINHNNDIDDQIIAELNEADVVLADLTYTRPSVYYEAGYAQGRPIPVVYTSRHDHIGRKATDDNRRVHFDLQMRNIVAWKNPSDREFFTRLGARISLLTAPMIRSHQVLAERRKSENVFAELSLAQQLSAISDTAAKTFKKRKFRVTLDEGPKGGAPNLRGRGRRIELATGAKGDTCVVASLWALPSLGKKDLAWLGKMQWIIEPTANLNVLGRPPKLIEYLVFVISPRKVSDHIVRSSFPSASCDANQTATYPAEKFFVPAPKFWRKGSKVICFHGIGIQIDGKNFKCNERGTFEKRGFNGEVRRGDSVAVTAVRRYIVIGGVKDMEPLSNRIAGWISDNR